VCIQVRERVRACVCRCERAMRGACLGAHFLPHLFLQCVGDGCTHA
jgi:hypothetical protein